MFSLPSYFPNLAPSEYSLFVVLKKMLQGKRFGSSEEVIAESEAYFESNDESFYKKGIENLEKRWNEYQRYLTGPDSGGRGLQ